MATKSKEKKEKKEKKDAKPDQPYVACTEVKQYLTELSNVLGQISEGILDSIKTMDERVQGDKDNDK